MSTLDGFAGGLFESRDDFVLTLLDNMIWPILALVILAVYLLVPQTLQNVRSVRLIMWSAAPLALLVLAESLCLLSGHFDLSIGSIAGFSAMVSGMVLANCPSCWGLTTNPWIGFALIFTIGALIGVFNGVMVARFNVNPFLQTLAVLIIFQGGKTALNTQPISGLPSTYLFPGGTANFAIGVLIVAFVLFGVVMRYTPFGQAVYALGSDKGSALEVGIRTDRVIIAVYTISGVLSAFAGLLLTGFVGVVPPLIGEGLVFQAFAGAVIGGISLFGGRGKVTGALGGVLLIALIQSALNNSAAIEATQIQFFNGVVLLIAILLYNTRTSIRGRILASGAQ